MKRLLLLAMALSVLVAGSSATADTISYSLGLGNPVVSGFTGPYVDVLVDRTSGTTADITFTALSNGTQTFLIGNGGSAGVNVNATSWLLSAILGVNVGTGFTPGPFSDGLAGVEDGFGSFNQTINDFDGYTHTVSSLMFTLTNTSGSWASAGDVLALNGSGFVAAAHVFVAGCATASACTGVGNDALATGFATVPEPGTALLVAFGLIGLGLRRR